MANIIADACVGKIYDLIADHVIKNVKRHVAYVIRYKDKVQELEQKNTELSEKKERIQEMVDRETNCGRVIIPAVSSWLEKLVQMEAGIANLPQQENEESFKCFKGCMCPNLTWRYKRGKEADKRKSKVVDLISKGDELKDSPVARFTSFQWESQFDSSQYYTMFSSRASVVDDIKNALKDSNVDMIGVHGPGGAGKTTMVKEVAKEAKKLGIFDKIVIAVVSKDPNISKLREDIAIQLDLEYKQSNELGRADKLRKALLNEKRKILVTLDDLWQDLDLNEIGIPRSGLGDKGCKILLTSRREEVFKRMEVGPSVFSIDYLKEQEAWELFTKVTGDFGVDVSTAKEVCKKCAGLPIAIVSVGATLKSVEEVEWRNALLELEKSPLQYIEGVKPQGYTPLRWSYEFLKDEGAKSCFLLCCLFDEDAEISIDELVRWSFASGFLRGEVNTLEVARIKVQIMVNKLKKSCLLLNGAQRNFVKMHDVIRDLAISITKEKQAKQSGGKDDNVHSPFDVFHCPLMHTLALKRGKSPVKIPNGFFQGMEEARVLALEDMSVDLPSLVLELKHLRMLALNNCKLLGGLSTTRCLKNVKILVFEESTMEELPQEIGELIHLQSLDMRECTSLKVIPKGVISKLVDLEELYVSGNFKEWDTTIYGGGMSNASIVELKSLTQLTVLHVRISAESSRILVQEYPNLFKKLRNFAIFIVDEDFRNRSPNVLEIDGIHHIDEFHPLMDKVEELRLSNIQDLPQLHFTPNDRRSFTFSKLTYLQISECNSSKYLFSPSSARALQQLQTLKVQDCRQMEQIIGVGDHYHEEEVITEEAIIFSRLRKMHLIRLPQFRSFSHKMEKTTIEGNPLNWTTPVDSIFNEKVSFPLLEDLEIDELPMKAIWNKQTIQSSEGSNNASLSQLKNVKVIRCLNLVNVFPSNMLPQLQKLETLRVWRCPSLTLLVSGARGEGVTDDGMIKFCKLKKLVLIDLPDLKSFYQSKFETLHLFNDQVSFPLLEDLEIDELPVKAIWNKQTIQSLEGSNNASLSQVKNVKVTQCLNLVNVFPSNMLPQLQKLETLCVRMCPSLTLLVSEARGEGVTDDGMIEFCKLKKLVLVDLPDLKSFYQSKFETSHLFIDQVSFHLLEDLEIIDLPMKAIWKKQMIQSSKGSNNASFSLLKNVNVIRCRNLVNVFPSNMLPQLQKLETLQVRNCQFLTLLVSGARGEGVTDDVMIKFNKLKGLILIDLPDLKSFSQSKFETSHLFNDQVSFPLLEDLEIDELPVKAIWNKQTIQSLEESNNASLSRLKNVKVTQCLNLVNVFPSNMLPQLQKLETLCVRMCPSLTLLVFEARGEGVTDDGMIKFCKLKKLVLVDLPDLKSFYQSKFETSYLFNDQVIFPKIEYLFLENLNSSREILFWDLLTTTQEHLKIVRVVGCQVSTKVSSHHQKRSFKTIDKLYLKNCQGFKHVIDVNGTISIDEEQFVDVKILELYDLPELVLLWSKNFHEIGCLRSLEYIIIKNCPQLKNLFTHFMATTLQHLKILSVTSCEMMEEIIIIEENNFVGEEKATRHIEFPKLRELILFDLPNLKNFCNDEKGSFSFSSLREIKVQDCPKMKTFASGQICLPTRMTQAMVGDQKIEITDLNAFFELRNEDSNHTMKTIYWGDDFEQG